MKNELCGRTTGRSRRWAAAEAAEKQEEEKITTGVKGKSTNPVRRSHYRLGFDCSGSAGTGATRYTLYSASVRFLGIYNGIERVHTGAPLPSCVYTRGSARVSVRPGKNLEKKEPPRYVGRSLIMSDRESVISKTITASTGGSCIFIPFAALPSTSFWPLSSLPYFFFSFLKDRELQLRLALLRAMI